MSDKKVKVKILKHVGAYVPDQIVEVTEEFAAHLCHVNVLTDGITESSFVRAMLLEDAQALDLESKTIENMTAAEAAQAGLKNVVGHDAELAQAEAELKKQALAEIEAEKKEKKKSK